MLSALWNTRLGGVARCLCASMELSYIAESLSSFLDISLPTSPPQKDGKVYNASPFFPFIQKPTCPLQMQTNLAPLSSRGGVKALSSLVFLRVSWQAAYWNFLSMGTMYNTDKHRLRMLTDWIPFGAWVREYWCRHEMGAKQSTPIKTAWGRNTNVKKTQTEM